MAASAAASVRAFDAAPTPATAEALLVTLDRIAALERARGGWTSAVPPARGVPVTVPLALAERLAAPLGLADWDVVALRSPGTPAAALELLDGYERTGRADYLEAARRASDLLLRLQMPSGGWFSEMPVEGDHVAPWFTIVRRTTLDDDVTTGGAHLLLALWRVTGDARDRAGAERALDLLVTAQLPSGAWPLVWRPWWKRAVWPTFEDVATINDDTTPAAIETLVTGGELLGRDDMRAAARRGGEWLLLVQGAAPRAGWAQQYDHDGHPARARRFEPPALASWESRYAIDALLALAETTGDRRYCDAVQRALAWLASSALRPGCWARFYTLDTNAPIYLDARGASVGRASNARPGYRWTGDFGISELLDRFGDERERAGAGASASDDHAINRPESVVPGDAGVCPGDVVAGAAQETADTLHALVAHAAMLLEALDGPKPSMCRPPDLARSPER